MEIQPTISVVMGVFNGSETVSETVDCVLCQTYRDFELLIVNDGSTDQTLEILEQLAKQDSRIRVLNQSNKGLTQALIHGCKEARGKFIARQDCGDRSLPTRFERQIALLQNQPQVVAVGLGARRIGPGGEPLGESSRRLVPEAVTAHFLKQGIAILHAGSMFRRDAYLRAGGYRPQFRVAQDHDLWYRLCEKGMLAECDEILFEVRIDDKGISAEQHLAQQKLSQIAKECYHARASGLSEAELLEAARIESFQNANSKTQSSGFRKTRARSAYFIGSQLYAQRDRRCLSYLRQSIYLNPFAPKVLAKLLVASLTCK